MTPSLGSCADLFYLSIRTYLEVSGIRGRDGGLLDKNDERSFSLGTSLDAEVPPYQPPGRDKIVPPCQLTLRSCKFNRACCFS
jgi:hypothetical protein